MQGIRITKIKYSGISTLDDFVAGGRLAKAIKKHGIKEVDKKVRDHPKHEAEKEKLKDKIIELQDELIELLMKEKYRDEEKEYSKSCLGLE
ncbi:hypothetical protein ACLF90_07765 [Helicobacter pylori]